SPITSGRRNTSPCSRDSDRASGAREALGELARRAQGVGVVEPQVGLKALRLFPAMEGLGAGAHPQAGTGEAVAHDLAELAGAGGVLADHHGAGQLAGEA